MDGTILELIARKLMLTLHPQLYEHQFRKLMKYSFTSDIPMEFNWRKLWFKGRWRYWKHRNCVSLNKTDFVVFSDTDSGIGNAISQFIKGVENVKNLELVTLDNMQKHLLVVHRRYANEWRLKEDDKQAKRREEEKKIEEEEKKWLEILNRLSPGTIEDALKELSKVPESVRLRLDTNSEEQFLARVWAGNWQNCIEKKGCPDSVKTALNRIQYYPVQLLAIANELLRRGLYQVDSDDDNPDDLE